MKWKEKFSDYFWKFIKWMTPETEADRIVNEMKKLDELPSMDMRGVCFKCDLEVDITPAK